MQTDGNRANGCDNRILLAGRLAISLIMKEEMTLFSRRFVIPSKVYRVRLYTIGDTGLDLLESEIVGLSRCFWRLHWYIRLILTFILVLIPIFD